MTIALAACGDAIDGEPDGSVLDSSTDGGLVTSPQIDWLDDGVPFTFAPCPDDWREVSEGALATCDPLPEDTRSTCARGSAHFIGEPGCAPIGAACPSGDFSDALPGAGTVIYVQAGAAPGGDGSRASPYQSLSEVRWISLGPGTTVALAKGTYEGTLPLRSGVTVVGACAAETRVTGVDAPVPAVVTVSNAGGAATLRDVSIADAPQIGVLVQAGRSLALDGVWVESNLGYGVVAAEADTLVTLNNVVVSDTRDGGPSGAGRGVDVQLGARLEATRVVIARNGELGIFTGSSGSVVLLTDAVVRDTLGRGDGAAGTGIAVELGARLEATRVLVEQNRDLGMLVSQMGTEAVLTDVVVRDTQTEARTGNYGRGVVVQMGARFEATRLLLARNRQVGLWAGDELTEVVLTDTVVRESMRRRPTDEDGGRGITITSGASLAASGLVIEDNIEIGLEAHNGSAIVISDAVIRRTAARASDGSHGYGVHLQLGARLEASRLLVEQSHHYAVIAATADTALTMSDAVLRDTRFGSGGQRAFGASAQGGARIVATRALIENTGGAGLTAIDGATVEMSDARVTRIASSDCAVTTCAGNPLGYGVVAVAGSIRLERFDVSDSATCGVFVAGPPERSHLDLVSGTVTGASIGACVQVDGYDLDRLTRNVRYSDNGANLDATMLPVPAPADPVEPLGF